MSEFDVTQFKRDLAMDEGVKAKVYQDNKGIPTIGVGRNLRDVGLSNDEIAYLLDNDVKRVCDTLDRNLPWWRSKPENVQRALANMCFNMGWGVFGQFRTFLAMIERGDYDDAADDLETTRWWGQVGDRGPRMQARLRGQR